MSNVIPFKFNSNEVRVIEQNDEPMFVAKDIAELLGYTRTADAIRKHCKGVAKMEIPSNGGVQSMQIIPERDVYRLIMRSKMPEAESFEDWVVGEVLPSIRKNGSYAQKPADLSRMEILKLAMESEQRAIDAECKLQDAQPAISFTKAVRESINSVTVQDFAKSVGTGQNKLYATLRASGYLMTGFGKNNKPYQQYVDQGLFKLQEGIWKNPQGETQTYFKTLITAKGQMYFQDKFFRNAA